MKVFKFGGASVKDADAVRNVAKVIAHFPGEELVVVVSAMGKTTNAMERVLWAWHGEGKPIDLLNERRQFHKEIMDDLFSDDSNPVYKQVEELFDEAEERIGEGPSDNVDYDYDQIVSTGELVSTRIVAAFLQQEGLLAQWFDVRQLIRTDNTYRDAKVDWVESGKKVDENLKPLFDGQPRIAITQGFLGATAELNTTTLGREGSDYTAAILAYLLTGESVTIWKDVPGVLNADPKWFDNTVKLDMLSYKEAIELAYYGATIIHPKTIQPLQNKKIPLYAKSFLNPVDEGTIIQISEERDELVPSFIFKVNQVLISISPKDFSFIIEENLSHIFECFANRGIKIHLMQNSAISFSVCVDHDERKLPGILEELKQEYHVLYNEGVELVTIRHYDQATIDRVTEGKEILLEQRSRETARMVMRDL